MYRYSLYKTSVDSYYNKKYTSNFYVIELCKIFFQFEFGKLNYKKCDLKYYYLTASFVFVLNICPGLSILVSNRLISPPWDPAIR